MQTLFLIVGALYSQSVFAGQMVYSNLYSENTLVQGVGKNIRAAEKDAVDSIPAGWKKDPANSPAIDAISVGGLVHMTIPIVRADAQ
jgi:hypothetical protein